MPSRRDSEREDKLGGTDYSYLLSYRQPLGVTDQLTIAHLEQLEQWHGLIEDRLFASSSPILQYYVEEAPQGTRLNGARSLDEKRAGEG